VEAPPVASDASRPVRPPRLRSPLARAVVPVLGGIAVLALILAATWAMAALISRGDAESSERLAPTEFQLGSVDRFADVVAESGPIVLPDLNTSSGTRAVVLDHRGNDPTRGWIVYWAYPADGDAACEVTQIRGTRTFQDCTGRRVDVSELAPPEGVRPIVVDGEQLWIDLRADDATSTTD